MKSEKFISEVVKTLIDINVNIDPKIRTLLLDSLDGSQKLEGEILNQILENHNIAAEKNLPLCQDTGVVIFSVKIGRDAEYDFDLTVALTEAVKIAYAPFRKSMVRHPLDRVNTTDNTPPVIYYDFIDGDKIEVNMSAKGAGCENMSKQAMLTPGSGYEGVKQFVIDSVFSAKGNPCPPILVGVGLGGDFEKSALLSKEVMFREVDEHATHPIDRMLEEELLKEINELGIGPMGLGGNTTALAVKVASYPCHIASLPVAVNIVCHVSRHAKVVI